MPSPSEVSKKDFDREAHDLLAFLQNFEIPQRHETKAHDAPPSASPPLSRQPLSTLGHNQEKVLDNDESLTTTDAPKNPIAPAGESWASRMSQALRDWREQHFQWTEQRLAEQRTRLEAEHRISLKELRHDLHEHYQEEFRAWKQEYISEQQRHQEDRVTTRTQVDTVTRPSSSRSRTSDDSPRTSTHCRQHWKSPDGKQITRYANGACREKKPDGSTVIRFPNGDVQTTGACEESQTRLCYYYGSSKTLRMDQIDGAVVWCFPSGQREKHFPDGRVVVDQWAIEDLPEGISKSCIL